MNQDFIDYYAYWPDALPREINRDRCHSECFGSKFERPSFGKANKDLHNTVNMRLEEMCFIKNTNNN